MASRSERRRLEILTEEASAEVLLTPLVHRLAGASVSVDFRVFQGKPDLLAALPTRLDGYRRTLARGTDLRVLVLIDADEQDCRALKASLDELARAAGLNTRRPGLPLQVLNRIAVRELEAWYFGDWAAARAAFPRLAARAPQSARSPDERSGKPSEAFARTLRSAGYRGAVERSKRQWASRIGPHLDPDRSSSASFAHFVSAVRELTA